MIGELVCCHLCLVEAVKLLEIKDHIIRFVELKNTDTLSIHNCGEYLLPAGIIKDGKIEDYETLQMILEQCVKE